MVSPNSPIIPLCEPRFSIQVVQYAFLVWAALLVVIYTKYTTLDILWKDPKVKTVDAPEKRMWEGETEDSGEPPPYDFVLDGAVELTLDNWDDYHPGRVFIKFYEPGCPFCQMLAPVWHEFALAAKKLPVTIAQVDCRVERDLCRREQMDGYPTLRCKCLLPSVCLYVNSDCQSLIFVCGLAQY